MISKILYILFLLLITACSSNKKVDRKAEIYNRLGYEYLDAGKYPEALQNFLESEKLAPRVSSTQNGLAMSYFARDKFDQALTHIQKAIQFDSKNMEAYNNLGRIHLARGDFSAAEKALSIAIQDLTNTEPEKPLTNMGILFSRKSQYSKAKGYFLKAIQTNRDYCPPYKEYGFSLLKQKKYAESGNLFDKAIKVCKNSADEVHYFGALSYYQMGQIDIARARLQEVIRLYPTSNYLDKAKEILKAIGDKPNP